MRKVLLNQNVLSRTLVSADKTIVLPRHLQNKPLWKPQSPHLVSRLPVFHMVGLSKVCVSWYDQENQPP